MFIIRKQNCLLERRHVDVRTGQIHRLRAFASVASPPPQRDFTMNQSTMDMQAIQANMKFVGDVRLTGAVFSGIAAGILGLTNLYGFAFYYFIYLCATALLVVKARSRACVCARVRPRAPACVACVHVRVSRPSRSVVVLPHSACRCVWLASCPGVVFVFDGWPTYSSHARG
jgi:hypothetical protein